MKTLRCGRLLWKSAVAFVLCAGVLTTSALAANVTGNDSWDYAGMLSVNVIDTGTSGSAAWQFGGKSITATVTSGTTNEMDAQYISVLTLTNDYTKPVTISFDSVVKTDDNNFSSFQILVNDQTTFSAEDYYQNNGYKNIPDDGISLGNYCQEMAVSDQLTITVEGPAGYGKTTTLNITNITLSYESDSGAEILFPSVTGGSYTVNDNEAPYTYASTGAADETVAVTATPASDYQFAYWRDQNGNILGSSADGTIVIPKDASEIYPVFVSSSAQKVFFVGDTGYFTWQSAFSAAGTGGTVALKGNYTLSTTPDDVGPYALQGGTYKIGAGQTLIIPYDDTNTGLDSATQSFPYANYNRTALQTEATPVSNASALQRKTAKHTLTVSENCVLSNSGILAIGGEISDGTGISGATTINYSEIVLQDGASLDLEDNSVLSSCGYVTGQGTVRTMGTNANIYQPMVIMDFRGGGYTVGCIGSNGIGVGGDMSEEANVSPFTRYTVQNIQASLELDYGNAINVYCVLYASDNAHQTTACIVGTDTGIIKLYNGSVLSTSYDAGSVVDVYKYTGRTKLDIYGGAETGSLALTVTLGTDVTIQTSELTFPIPYNYEIQLHDGEYVINSSYAIFPGMNLIVDKDAKLSTAGSGTRLLVMDALLDYTINGKSTTVVAGRGTGSVGTQATADASGSAEGYRYPTPNDLSKKDFSKSGVLIVNGILEIKSGTSFGGIVQTTSDGARIYAASGATLSGLKIQVGLADRYTIDLLGTGKLYAFCGASLHTLNARIADASGNIAIMESGKYYYGRSIGNYTLNKYQYTYANQFNETKKWGTYGSYGYSTTSGSFDVGQNFEGSWHTENLRVVNGTLDGKEYATLKDALDAGYVYTTDSTDPNRNSYIQLMYSYPEDNFAVSQDICLDLNGKTLKVLASDGYSSGKLNMNGKTLYGMDSKTDGYVLGTGDNAPGSITVSGTVAPVTEFTGKQNVNGDTATLHRYLDVADGSTHTFHRFNISVTDYYLEVLSTGAARIGFGSTFRGDSDVITALTDMGFTINDTPAWANGQEGFDLKAVQDRYKLYYTVDATEMGNNTAIALVKFGESTEWKSDKKTVNFMEKLNAYYNAKETPEDQKVIIDKFKDELSKT